MLFYAHTIKLLFISLTFSYVSSYAQIQDSCLIENDTSTTSIDSTSSSIHADSFHTSVFDSTSEPAVSEPAVSEPAVSEPTVSEPTASEPIASEPDIVEPDRTTLTPIYKTSIAESNLPLAIINTSPEPAMEMTFTDAVESLLEHNTEIRKARLEWQASHDRLFASFGIFEPALVGNVKSETTERPLALINQIQNSYSGGIEGSLPTATKYNLNFSLTDIQNRFSDNTTTPFTFVGLTVTQPVLRGLWFGKPTLDIKVARIDKEIALHKYRSTLFSKLFELETNYWKLRFTQEKLVFATTSVNIAQEIVDDSRLQLRAGKISPLDAVEASAALAARQTGLIDAQKDLISAMNELKLLIAGRTFLKDTLVHASSHLALEAKDIITDFSEKATIDLYLIQPDYLQKKNELQKEKLSYDYQLNQCLPELNLKGSCGYLVSGKLTDIAWSRFLDYEYRSRSGVYSAEIELRIPLGMNIRERSLLQAEKRNLLSAEIDLHTIQVQIENYLSASRKRVVDLHTNLQNAKIVINYRQALLEAEIARQKAGKSNYRKIFDVEEDLTKSKQWEMESLIDFRSLTAQLARLTGTILLDKNLEVLKNGKPVLTEKLTGRLE